MLLNEHFLNYSRGSLQRGLAENTDILECKWRRWMVYSAVTVMVSSHKPSTTHRVFYYNQYPYLLTLGKMCKK